MLRIFLALWLAITPAFAWAGSMMTMGVGAPSASAPTFSLTFGQSANQGSNVGTTYDYGTLTYGAGCTRVIVANIWVPGTSFTVTGVTVGGVSLSPISGSSVNTGASGVAADVWESTSALGGTSGQVKVTYSATLGFTSSAAVYCLVTTTPTNADAKIGSNGFGSSVSNGTALTVPTGGGALVLSGSQTGHTATFTNTTIDSTTSEPFYFGHTTSTGSITVTGTYSGNDGLVLSLVSWGP